MLIIPNPIHLIVLTKGFGDPFAQFSYISGRPEACKEKGSERSGMKKPVCLMSNAGRFCSYSDSDC
jgi:hypothetical protein